VGDIAVVHNGIIENYLDIKENLLKEGHRFASETDTEIVSHLVVRHLSRGADYLQAIQLTLQEIKGSYAGAMGKPQFISSSFRRYAVDFDNDGKRDLWENSVDVIGSVANYFSAHGWQRGGEVAVPASFTSTSYRSMNTGFRSKHSLGSLRKAGIRPKGKVSSDSVSLLKYSTYDGDELWLGMHNFYVITRYNHSSKYALAVHQLAQEVKRRYDRLRIASSRPDGQGVS
jgi:membrane-bound lytic murein transglycosylase B